MRPFTDILREARRGAVVELISEEMETVIKAVRHTGKAGALTLKIDIKPRDQDAEQVNLSFKVTAKAPSAPMPEALFFTTLDGDLLRDDPTQREMFTPTDGLGDRLQRGVSA